MLPVALESCTRDGAVATGFRRSEWWGMDVERYTLNERCGQGVVRTTAQVCGQCEHGLSLNSVAE
jgi:hypothetical protein